jgi:hypothetical protein
VREQVTSGEKSTKTRSFTDSDGGMKMAGFWDIEPYSEVEVD